MKSELIVDVQAGEFSIALLEDGRLVSLQKEARNIDYAVGDIYLAKVKKLMPGLNAAFVNVGYEKDAFLHYLDLGPRYSTYKEYLDRVLGEKKSPVKLEQIKLQPEIDKHGTIASALQPGQPLLVQIVKEPISSKGPRLTTELSFTGRYLVLTPFCDKINISQKIKSSPEKMRLRQIVESIKPRNFGVIVRTSAEGKKSAELYTELRTLVQLFYDTCLKAQRSEAPSLVFEEENRVVSLLRDVFSPSFESIYVNDKEIYDQILKYVSIIAPERTDIVKLYEKDTPIFDHFSITKQIKSSFGKTVSFKSGAYIIIEHTEALHVIDVNSGNRTKADSDQESNALEVNLRAADEIARQLRLRDMGGIIVVDFIDMAKPEHRQELYEHMREVMANDRARHNILPLSKFGLMQITRQRVRPALDIHTNEECPSCHGKGEVQPSILFTDTLEEKIEYLTQTLSLQNFIMYVHPFVEAYIKKGFFTNIYAKWRRRYGRKFKVIADQSLAYLQYRVIDAQGKELNLVEEKDSGKSSAKKNADKTAKRNDAAEEKAEPKPKNQPKEQPKQQTKAQDKPKEIVKEQTKAQNKPKEQAKQNEQQKSQPKAKEQTKAKAQPKASVPLDHQLPPAENNDAASDSEQESAPMQPADKTERRQRPRPKRKPRPKNEESDTFKNDSISAEPSEEKPLSDSPSAAEQQQQE